MKYKLNKNIATGETSHAMTSLTNLISPEHLRGSPGLLIRKESLIVMSGQFRTPAIFLIWLQIKITSWAIVSLAGGGLGKVKEVEPQDEKEKNHPSHLQEAKPG